MQKNLNPQSSQSNIVLSTSNLTLTYGAAVAFKEVSVEIESGQITGLVGPSGCGKTSFLSCLNRLTDYLSHCKVQGQVLLNGHNILDKDYDVISLRRRVGMIFQKPNPFPLSIFKNIAFPLREHGIDNKSEVEDRVKQAFVQVGLWEEVSHRIHKSAQALSGGQQQRLCIARALALEPEILLLDEPCSALDPLSSGVVEDLIASLKGKVTQMVVTHNLAQARRLADNVAFFWNLGSHGELVEFGSCEQIFESPCQSLTAAYINGVRG